MEQRITCFKFGNYDTYSTIKTKIMTKLTDKIIKCLKDKHDNWIGSQENNETQAENKGFKQGLEWAIDTIETLEVSAEFEEVARVMMKHLGQGEKYHPNYTVIITNSSAELVEGKHSTGWIMDYVPD